MKTIQIAFLLIFLILTAACKSIDVQIRENFHPRIETASAAFQFHYVIRTEYTNPDSFYLLNLKTFELYPLSSDPDRILYHDSLPLGEYRIGYFTGTLNQGRAPFRVFNYSHYRINIPSKGRYSFGRFFFKVTVESLKIYPAADGFTPMPLGLKKYSDYKNIMPVKELTDDANSPVFPEYQYGQARYLNQSPEDLDAAVINAAAIEKKAVFSQIEQIRALFSKDPDAAVTQAETLFRKTGNLNYLAESGILYYKSSRLEKAEAAFQKLHERDPNAPEYYGFQGLVHFQNQQTNEAFDLLYRAVSLKTEWGEVYHALARILFEKKNMKMARLISDYSLKLEPDNADFQSTSAQIRREIQK
jgi:tetratricopeptide (TPR) repeat protein